MAAILPSVVIILAITGYATNWFANRYLNTALERTVKVQVMAMAHEMGSMLERSREDILFLARGSLDRRTLSQFLSSSFDVRGDVYREVAFIAKNPSETVYLLHTGDAIQEMPADSLSQIKPNPLLLSAKVAKLPQDAVILLEMSEVFYPLPSTVSKSHLADETFRLVTPVHNADGTMRGYLILAIDAQRLRDILTLFNSTKSPIHAFSRTSVKRFSYFVDKQGWMLFQSEPWEESVGKELSTGTARAGYSGDYGKPEYGSAFRPSPTHEPYWSMVVDLQNGKSGLLNLDGNHELSDAASDHIYLGYAPVLFRTIQGETPEVVGGVAFEDRSLLTMAAEMRQFDVMFTLTVVTALLVSAIIFVLSRIITRPIRALSDAVGEIQRSRQTREISLPDSDQETTALMKAINLMMSTLLSQKEELRAMDRRIHKAQQRERALSEDDLPDGEASPLDNWGLADIVGKSQAVEALRAEIVKAASVEADVLIIGETGTGKELTAAAIHKCSARSAMPFISINCGALDENLLLDALFGHVKGAFTEAKSDRKGAFLAANGGTLLLDEIGNASPKVQQALLRALSVRKVTPLGSDAEIDMDVRLVAATNIDLERCSREGTFRSDLYYRLKVLSLRTPPLRERPDDIPMLAENFLREAATAMKRNGLGLSRGALDRLKSHSWPGNIRELKNVMTRAVAMAEGNTIQVEDLCFDEERLEPAGAAVANGKAEALPQDDALADLNQRQRMLLPHLARNQSITRLEYQRLVGSHLSLRTAQYDLNDMILKGILEKVGKGPATRYVLSPSFHHRPE